MQTPSSERETTQALVDTTVAHAILNTAQLLARLLS
jgi:hypothetical protein